jgi:hypothetical protein
MKAGEGKIPNLPRLLRQIADATETADRLEKSSATEQLLPMLLPRRTTSLDPARPARDLLEDLLLGIHGCWLLYQEYVDEDADTGSAEGDEDEQADVGPHTTDAFIEEVRARAAADADRLL